MEDLGYTQDFDEGDLSDISPLDASEIDSNDEGNESVTKGGDK